MQGYARLALEERYHIETLCKAGLSIRRIATGMGRSASTSAANLGATPVSGAAGISRRGARRGSA